MNKIYSFAAAFVLGAGAAFAASPVDFTFATAGDLDGWTVGNKGTYEVAGGHLTVQMANVNASDPSKDPSYRADLAWGSNTNESPIVLGADVKYIAIKFMGTRPAGNLTLQLADTQEGTLVEVNYNNTPTGSVATPGGNTIYYYQLDKNSKYSAPFDARRITFKVADCKTAPFEYSVDWIKSFDSLEEIEAAKTLADDGTADSDDVAKTIVYNETTSTSYDSLVEAWAAAASGDVLSLNEDVVVAERLNSNSRDITIKGNDHIISRAANYKGLLFLTVEGKDAEGNTIKGAGKVTLENLTISGANVEVTGQVIEAGNGGRFILNDVEITDCVTTSLQGVIAAKSNGGITANNVEITGCTVPAGYGEMFGGSNTIELSGNCTFTLFLEGSIHATDKGVDGGAVTVMFLVAGDKYVRNLEASVINGTESNTYFPCGINGYKLEGNEGALYIAQDESGIANVAVENAPASIYNLQGMPVRCIDTEALPAGLYIINGKKVVVK